MNEYLITVVIPSYHRSDRVARAVESALLQTANVEVIVVDDNGKGSKEQINTEKALSHYIQSNEIIYLVNEKNSRASFSRNQGLAVAKGKYITFLDDDDEINPTKLEKQADLLEQLGEEYSCCYTSYHKIMKEGKSQVCGENISGYVYPYVLARVIYNGSGSNLLCRTSDAKRIGGYDIDFKKRQDMEFMTRLLKNRKLAFVDEDLLTIHYEIRENTLTYEGLVESDELYIEKFKDEIDSLPNKQRQMIYSALALERWRYSIPRHQQKDAIQNMKKYHVGFVTWVRYIFYLIHRILRKKSYGIKLIKQSEF